MRKIDRLIRWGGVALVAAAVASELRRPAGEREWHGMLAGVVPYDLRPPTPDRVRRRMWDPDNDALFVPQVFGVGWTVNLGRLARAIQTR